MTHTKLLKALEEKDHYEAEEKWIEDMVKKCRECENCMTFREHMEKCKAL